MMAKALKLGELLESAFTPSEQARILLRMRATLDQEATKQARATRKSREKRKREPPSTLTRRANKQKQIRLLTVLHTSTDMAQIQTARRELDAIFEDVAERSPSAAAQHREGRNAAIIAHHQPGRSAFWSYIGPAPNCGPADTATAMVFWRRITAAIDRGGWTHGERSALYDLEKKWGPRARGEDVRFNVVGTVGGRLPRALEAKIRQLRQKGIT